MKTVTKLLLIVAAVLAVVSCEKYVITIGEVHFAADIEPIFVNRCSGCHPDKRDLDLSQGNVYTSLTTHTTGNGTKLIDLQNPEESFILVKATDGHSSNNVSTGEEQKILTWIENGALND